MANLSEHFTLEEMTSSDTAKRLGFLNIPEDQHLLNLMKLCSDLLEPIRVLVGCPVKINSGFRSPRLNAAVGGVPTSAHMDGRAADFVVPGWDLSTVWQRVKELGLPFDQLIWEKNGVGSQWIHIALPPAGVAPRKEVLELRARPLRKYVG